MLGEDFDVEIIERHHSKKVDAPSGTALMLVEALAVSLPYEPEYVYDRHMVRRPREHREIGISSVRGGTIAGDHEVLFAGKDEIIELRHCAQSREVFAAGAAWEGPMPGKSAAECGNYINLDTALARTQCAYYCDVIRDWTVDKLSY